MKIVVVFVTCVIILSFGCRRYEITSSAYGFERKKDTVINGFSYPTYDYIYILDTYTGKVWREIREVKPGYKNQDTNWVYVGNPTHIKK